MFSRGWRVTQKVLLLRVFLKGNGSVDGELDAEDRRIEQLLYSGVCGALC